jgi:histidinol-phosphate/aromatic aminotransferase/cobyric acid decarboxylase-like protein
MSLVQAGDNVMVFRAFAKAHGLAALSFGYASAPRTWAEHRRKQGLEHFKLNYSHSGQTSLWRRWP